MLASDIDSGLDGFFLSLFGDYRTRDQDEKAINLWKWK